MLRNYFLTAIRNLQRNRVYSGLNVIGLALGIGCALVIFKVVSYELSFDKHQENYDRIYRVVRHDIYPDRTDKGQGVPHPLGVALDQDYAQLEIVSRMHYAYGDQINIKKEDGTLEKHLYEEGIVFADSNFFKMFTVEWVAGNEAEALTGPQTVVISESVARNLFGLTKGSEANALGRLINYNSHEDFQVTGIIKDPPPTTNFPFTMLFEYHSALSKTNPYYGDGTRWNSTSSSTNVYILPRKADQFDEQTFNGQLVELVEKYRSEGETAQVRFLVQPLKEVHFDDDYGSYVKTTAPEFLRALGVIGIFLILTACINFINLATAQAANRSKEIGIRKAIGSMTGQLVTQFLAEIALITFCAVLLSLAIGELMFITLEEVLGYRLTLDLLNDPMTLLFLLGLFVLVTLLSGFYPSVLLSRMNTVMALKNKISAKNHSGGLPLRKGLVVLQFTITQFLIIGTLVIGAQMKYIGSKDLGFETEAILTTYLPQREDEVKNERFRQEMLNSAAIADVTFSLSQPTGSSNSHSGFNYAPLESEVSYHGNFKVVDGRFMDFFGLEMLAGRKVRKGDSSNIVINRKIADLMGFKNDYDGVLGETLSTGWGGDKQIVGVAENFHTYSLADDIDYVIFLHSPRVFYSISFKTSSEHGIEAALDHFRSTWERIYPEYVVDYSFYDEQIAQRYDTERNVSTLLRTFSIISILIGCLGLYGLISFIALNKTKEIGVRKVLGASAMSILRVFSTEVVILMIIAFVLAAPIAFFGMNAWLEDYKFRVPIGPEFFAAALMITLVIAILTISHRTISSALINPADVLKDE